MQLKQYLGKKFRNYTLNKHPGLYRPSSEPFLTGDTLRKFSDHIFDETKTLKTNRVKKNDVVFIRTDLKDIYFEHYHKKINNSYIAILHNSDASFEESDVNKIDAKIIHCFSQNLNIKERKNISPIPIGFENRRFRSNGKISNLIQAQNIKAEKKEKIFSSFNITTNFNHRKKLKKMIDESNLIEFSFYIENYKYLNQLSKFKYNLCPKGNGFDTHRVWESILVKTVPIVESNQVNINLFNQGIPLFLIDNLEDITDIQLNKLLSKEIEIPSRLNMEYLYFDYWRKLINSKKI